MGHMATVQQQQAETVAMHENVKPDADMESQQLSDDSPPPESAKHKSGTQQQQQEVSTTSTRDMLLQNALALFMPGKAPQYAKHAATAAAADGAAGTNSPIRIPNLPHLADSRELQLVAAAFAAGAAAGASGQLTAALPLLEQFSSGDISNSGFAVDSAAPAPTDAAAESMPAPARAGAAAQQDSGAKSNAKAAKSRSSAAVNQKSTYRGVFWDRKNNRWRAQVGHNNRKIFMGYFSEPTEAARAYDKKLVQLRGTMAKTNFPLQDYAEDLQLHKELRARENGDELLLLPLEELQAHLQQHLQELLPKQPALQKVYSDWSRRKAQSEALVQLSKDRMRLHGHGIPYWVEQGQLGDASGGGSVGHSDWVSDTAIAASGELMQAPRSNNSLPASLLEQQWSSSLHGHQQEAQQQQQQLKVQAQQAPTDFKELSEAALQVLQQAHQLQQQNSSGHSSPTGIQEGGSSRNSPAAAAAAGGSNGRVGAASSGGARAASNSAQKQQREPPKTLQQHLLTRLHEQRVHRSSSGTSMEALLAAAAVLEEEEEVAATMCGQLHDLVSAAQAAEAGAAAAAAAGQPGSTDKAVASALTAAAAAAAAGGDSAEPAGVRKGHKSGRTHRIKQGTVVTDTAALVVAILTSPTSLHLPADAAPWQQQQEDRAPAASAAPDAAPEGSSEQQPKLQEDEDQGQLSPLGALHRQMLQPPATEQQVMQTVQLADKAGLNKEGQQLLLLVMYHQLLDLQKQQQQQQQEMQPASAAAAPAQEPAAQPAPQHRPGQSNKPADAHAAAHSQLPTQQQARGSVKRPQQAQEPEQRPAKQLCQGVGGEQPSRLAVAIASSATCAAQGASRSLPTKAVLDLSSC